MENKKIKMTFRLDAENVRFLDKPAGLFDRDRSYLIRQAVADFISQQKWQIEDIDKAIAEADRGEFLTNDEFRAEVRSWLR